MKGAMCVTMMDPGEELDWRYPDHNYHQPYHGPGGDEVQAEAELPAASTSLVLGVEVLADSVTSPADTAVNSILKQGLIVQ